MALCPTLANKRVQIGLRKERVVITQFEILNRPVMWACLHSCLLFSVRLGFTILRHCNVALIFQYFILQNVCSVEKIRFLTFSES